MKEQTPIADPTDLSAYGYIKPDSLIVKRYPPGCYDKGNIVLPDSSKTVQNIGWIIRAGGTAKAHGLTEGMTIIFRTDSSADVPLVSRLIDGQEKGLKDLVEINYEDVILAHNPQQPVQGNPRWTSGSVPASNRGESGQPA
jgi:hypothetical protein